MPAQRHIAFFAFTLRRTESIGPNVLHNLWVDASGIGNVSVGRREPEGAWRNLPIYTLYAPRNLGNLNQVELRLRQALELMHLHASLTVLHL